MKENSDMKIVIGSDHAGYELKEAIKKHLSSKKISFKDIGTDSSESTDYPDYAKSVALYVGKSGGLGILICGTGLGMCMAANKFREVRAATCRDANDARMAREHNNANVLCLGGRTTDEGKAKEIVDTFIQTKASPVDRHRKRLDKIAEIEEENFK